MGYHKKDKDCPQNWKLVVNYSKNFYNTENVALDLKNSKIYYQIINLNKQYLSEEELSLFFFSCDAVFLPYKVCSGSGVCMMDWVMENPLLHLTLVFSKNFPNMNLGIVSKREPRSFEKAFVELEKDYRSFESAVKEFRQKINWNAIARQHCLIYENIMEKQKMTMEIASTKHTNQYP